MSSNDGSNPSFGDLSSFDETSATTSTPWPFVPPGFQKGFEKHFLEKGATIHFDRLPDLHPPWYSESPISFFGGMHERSVSFVIKKVFSCSTIARRPLTALEVDRTSEAAARSAQYLQWINPVSAALAFGFTVYTRTTFKFPYFRVKDKVNISDPLTFPSKRLSYLTGQRAVNAWRCLRFVGVFPVAWAFTFAFFRSIMEFSFQGRLNNDPRLKPLMEDMYATMMRNLHTGRQTTRPPINAQFPRGRHYPKRREYERETHASQTEKAIGASATDPNGDITTSAPQPSWDQPKPPQEQYHPPQEDDSDFDTDDASPVSPSSRRAEPEQAPKAKAGSSWARIRQEAQSGSAQWTQGDSSGQERGWGQLRQDKTPNSREDQPKRESFAYSEQDEDREKKNYEKDQAQKDFDALLEAERRGGSNK
ncbi:hypothetical protein GGR54DRAFT_636188 [Hypoxylon sp. NC1633]|nr:hypothetical protein GGR54DRAFT_636188 [Hypoxylon sp. NC1633]